MRFGVSRRYSAFSSNARSSLHRYSTAPCLPLLSLVPSSPSLPQLLQAHAQLVVRGLAASRAAMAHLLAHCALCPSAPPHYFRAIYARIDRPNVFAANNLLRCLARSAAPRDTLLFYSRSHRAGLPSNNYTFPFLLQACSRAPVVAEGAQVHADVVKLGLDGDLYVRNALIHFYSSCCEMDKSKRVFNEFPEHRDVVTWNAMLAGFARTGQVDVAEELFEGMPERDVISWSTMIMGYVQGGILEKGLKLFREMVDRGLVVNEAALVTALSASAQLGLLENGWFIHSTIRARNFSMTRAVGQHGWTCMPNVEPSSSQNKFLIDKSFFLLFYWIQRYI